MTPKVKGIVDETAHNFVGVISGMAADGLMVEALKASDLLIGFGLDPVEVDKTWHAELPIEWLLESTNVAGRLPCWTRRSSTTRQLLDALATAPVASQLGAAVCGVPEETSRDARGYAGGTRRDVARRYDSRAGRRCAP